VSALGFVLNRCDLQVIISTYQAASGAGAEGMAELKEGVATYTKTGVVPAPKVRDNLPSILSICIDCGAVYRTSTVQGGAA
jgi:aspartate-semialdehyde dehydrogenase